MNITELVKKAHEASRSKGWYDGKDAVRNVPEMLALIHSEVSEALEDYRNGNMARTTSSTGKPEGFPSEMADVAIRIGDLCGYLQLNLKQAIVLEIVPPIDHSPALIMGTQDIPISCLVTRHIPRGELNVPEQLARIHKLISDALDVEFASDRQGALARALIRVGDLCGYLKIDLEQEIVDKMSYNETRPYRHGGKVA